MNKLKIFNHRNYFIFEKGSKVNEIDIDEKDNKVDLQE